MYAFSLVSKIHTVEIWPEIRAFVEILWSVHCKNLEFYPDGHSHS